MIKNTSIRALSSKIDFPESVSTLDLSQIRWSDLQFEVENLMRVEAAPLGLPQALLKSCPASLAIVGYHHCPALCRCAKSKLMIFDLEITPFHRALAANILSLQGLQDELTDNPVLAWRTAMEPPGDLKICSPQQMVQASLREEDRQGFIIGVYGPFARKGFYLLEFEGTGHLPPLSSDFLLEMHRFHTQLSQSISQSQRMAELTDREVEVTRWIVYGKSNRTIAEILNISTHTVNGYLRRIFLKTGTADRVSLAIYAVNHGVV